MISKEEDPLWDMPERRVIGHSFYYLEPLAYQMNNEYELAIISNNGVSMGKLIVDVVPVEEGKMIYDNDNPPDDPYDLVSNPLIYAVCIKSASEIPEYNCKDIQVEYVGFHEEVIQRTKVIQGRNTNPIFEEIFEHRIDYLQKNDIFDLLKDKVF
jgi:hypothetical protein